MEISHLAAVISIIWGFQVRPFHLLRSSLSTAALLAAEAVACKMKSEGHTGQHIQPPPQGQGSMASSSCALTHVPLFATPRTAARQAPLSMGFPRQDYGSRLPFAAPGDLLDTDGTHISLAPSQLDSLKPMMCPYIVKPSKYGRHDPGSIHASLAVFIITTIIITL